MKKHELLFSKLKAILLTHFRDRLKEKYDGNYIYIEDTTFWISCDFRELTIGYDYYHEHFDGETDDLNEAVESIVNLLSHRVRITQYLKGNSIFKCDVDIEISDSEYIEIGGMKEFFFPFWKKTTLNILFKERIIEDVEIIREVTNTREVLN